MVWWCRCFTLFLPLINHNDHQYFVSITPFVLLLHSFSFSLNIWMQSTIQQLSINKRTYTRTQHRHLIILCMHCTLCKGHLKRNLISKFNSQFNINQFMLLVMILFVFLYFFCYWCCAVLPPSMAWTYIWTFLLLPIYTSFFPVCKSLNNIVSLW